MIEIPFAKLHGTENDFLLTWNAEISAGISETAFPQVARHICARNTGIGADGWMLVWPEAGALGTRLFNSDGSEPEISGNGTRCAAAFGLFKQALIPPHVSIITKAGKKELHLISRSDKHFIFEMDMGLPEAEEIHATIRLDGSDFDATILNVGNPQCAIFVKDFPGNWRTLAQQAERHDRFPQHTNVSFVRVLDRHTIETIFYERGAGETRSSGTGSTAAAAAAILRGIAESPINVVTPAATLALRWSDSIYLTGPAEMIGEGRFFLDL
ncbi:MAG: diaminopimelate epimerase [Acidobacteriaceae bacterium]|nr:diaminopimelate epimerase [Acidobacteriaceae bacterium]MBV9779079.1 diaminopimelate epimerase [Acidobacteriaceae bacterium]